MHSLFTGLGHSSKKYALEMRVREEGKREENMHEWGLNSPFPTFFLDESNNGK